jgi:hypothetical protein
MLQANANYCWLRPATNAFLITREMLAGVFSCQAILS